MNTIKVRHTDKGDVYFLAETGKTITSIGFIEYTAFEGLYTVINKDGKYYTFLPQGDGNKTYMELSKIIDKGYAVHLVN